MTEIHHSAAASSGSSASRGLSRRALTAAAWTVPVVAVAVATPAAAASTADIGAFVLAGSCGNAGITGPGFTLRAGSGDVPVGTTIVIVGSRVPSIGTFTATSDIVTISSPSSTARLVTFIGPLPAGAFLGLRTTLSLTTAFVLTATLTLPEGSVGSGAKSAASVSSDRVFCSGN